jgi:hypothetical protein
MSFAIVVNALVATCLSSQIRAATINGFVTDAATGENLPGATVIFKNLNVGTLSNDEGYYAIKNLPSGDHIMRITYIGYESQLDTISFTRDQQRRIDITLTPESVILTEETVITAKKLDTELTQQTSVTVLQAKTLKRLPSVGEPDLLRSLQLLPGVQSASDISSGLYVRGGGPDQTRILLDQVPLYNPAHAFGFFSTFNPDAIKDVTFYKGAYPAQYGGALGAVLDVQNKEGNRHKVSGKGALSLISGRMLVEGPLDNGSWTLSGRRTYLDPVLDIVRNRGTEVPDYYFYDLNGKINKQYGDRNTFVLSSYFGRDFLDFQLDPKADSFFNIAWGNKAIMGRWKRIFTPSIFGRFVTYLSQYHSDINVRIFDTPAGFSNKVEDISIKSDISYFASNKHTITTGSELSFFDFSFGSSFNLQEQFVLETRPLQLSLYLQDDWKPNPLIDARIGLRSIYFSEGRYQMLEPRLTLSYALRPSFKTKIATGIYHQYLQLVTSEGFGGGDFWVPLDETVRPGKSVQFVTGFEWDPNSSYFLSLEGYYTGLSRLVIIDTENVVDIEKPRSKDIFKTEGTGYATGVELFIEKRKGNSRGWLGYTLGWTRRQFNQIDGGRSFPPKYDRRHNISFTATRQMRRWTWSSSFVYGTGQAFTPASARYSLRDPATGLFSDRALAARKNTARLLPYHRMDLGLRRSSTIFGAKGEYYVEIFNVYSRRNEWFVQYDTENPETEPKVIKMLPVVPTFGLNFSF